MLCAAIPYEGNEPYIFLSYCHKDANLVYPLLERMAMDGCRIWYDDGIHPGDDWSENVARHLDNCKVCLAMITKEAAASHNCRSELNYAIECEKPVLAVVLEAFEMPRGLRLLLGTLQRIEMGQNCSDRELPGKLYSVEAVSECRGKEPMQLRKVPAPLHGSDPAPNHNQGDDDEPHTVYVPQKQPVVLLRMSNGEAFVRDSVLIRLGRSEKQCDVPLPDNPSVSSYHADLIQRNGKRYLRDAGSSNGTFVNGVRISKGESVELENPAVFRLYNEEFVLLCDELAKDAIMLGQAVFLQNVQTKEIKPVLQAITLGRDRPWPGGTFCDTKVSRVHAEIFCHGLHLYICDRGSTNGTVLCKYQKMNSDQGDCIWMHEAGFRLEANKPYTLGSKDLLYLGDTKLSVLIVKL